MATASTIITYATNVLKIDSDTIGVPGLESTQLLSFINQANIEYYNAHIQGGGEPPASFRAESGFDLVAETTLNGAVSAGATTVTLTSSTNFLTAGAAAIWEDEQPDVFVHTGNAANILTGVTGVGVAHTSGSTVQRLYQLPTDFGSLRSTQEAADGVLVDGLPYTLTSARPYGSNFAIHDDGTSKHLWLPRDVTGDAFVYYNSKPTTIDDTADSINVPVDDEYFVVWRVVEMGREVLGLNTDRVQEARARANEILLGALKRRNINKRIRTFRMPHLTSEGFGKISRD